MEWYRGVLIFHRCSYFVELKLIQQAIYSLIVSFLCSMSRLLERSRLNFLTPLAEITAWITHQVEGKTKTILTLMFQAAVYSVWKERNSRLLNWIIRALDSTVKEVQLQLRSKLFALDREDDHTFPHSSHHHTTPTSSQSRTYVSHLLIKQCIFNCISQK